MGRQWARTGPLAGSALVTLGVYLLTRLLPGRWEVKTCLGSIAVGLLVAPRAGT